MDRSDSLHGVTNRKTVTALKPQMSFNPFFRIVCFLNKIHKLSVAGCT